MLFGLTNSLVTSLCILSALRL
ncbi:hypothetical protein ID866_10263 [Astraeus odoratus]|nr:hypothetical protein ID866_10263 [Astraeus odoratus]